MKKSVNSVVNFWGSNYHQMGEGKAKCSIGFNYKPSFLYSLIISFNKHLLIPTYDKLGANINSLFLRAHSLTKTSSKGQLVRRLDSLLQDSIQMSPPLISFCILGAHRPLQCRLNKYWWLPERRRWKCKSNVGDQQSQLCMLGSGEMASTIARERFEKVIGPKFRELWQIWTAFWP